MKTSFLIYMIGLLAAAAGTSGCSSEVCTVDSDCLSRFGEGWTCAASAGACVRGEGTDAGNDADVGTEPCARNTECGSCAECRWSLRRDIPGGTSAGAVVVLDDGRVFNSGAPLGHARFATNEAHIWDPATTTWTSLPAMTHARAGHAAAQLSKSEVIVCGGQGAEPTALIDGTCEIYSFDTSSWTLTASMPTPRRGHSLLVRGGTRKAVVVGGDDGSSLIGSVEVYDAQVDAWGLFGTLAEPRVQPFVGELQGGGFLVVGGTIAPSKVVERFNPSSMMFEPSADLNHSRQDAATLRLANGHILVTGGINNGSAIATTEIFDPAADKWTFSAAMPVERAQHSLALLQDGRVLALGGVASVSGAFLEATALYDPSDATWTEAAPLQEGRRWPRVATWEDHGVLVIGGIGASGFPLSSTEMLER